MVSPSQAGPRSEGRTGRSRGAAMWASTAALRTVLGVLALCIVVWEAGCRAFSVPVYLLPAPSAVIGDLANAPEWLLYHAAYTLIATLLGFALAVAFGVANRRASSMSSAALVSAT